MATPVKLWWVVLRSLLITSSVGAGIGLCIGLIMKSVLAGLLAAIATIIAQFAISSLLSIIVNTRNDKAEFLASQVLKEAAERQLPYDLNCAYCNQVNRAGISFNKENTFECAHCKQPNKVYIQFTTVRLTVPLSQRDSSTAYVDMGDEDPGVVQSTINDPVTVK